MFDFSKSKFVEWTLGVPSGRYDFISCHSELGELSLKIMCKQQGLDNTVAFEILAAPIWYCVVDDERHQDQLLTLTSCDVFEVLESPVVSGFSENEALFDRSDSAARHWVILTMQECIHIVALEEPKVRPILGGENL